LGDFLEDGELSDEERTQLQEFFGQFNGRDFGGFFHHLGPDSLDSDPNADEAAFSA
jgi:hypothetical protein